MLAGETTVDAERDVTEAVDRTVPARGIPTGTAG